MKSDASSVQVRRGKNLRNRWESEFALSPPLPVPPPNSSRPPPRGRKGPRVPRPDRRRPKPKIKMPFLLLLLPLLPSHRRVIKRGQITVTQAGTKRFFHHRRMRRGGAKEEWGRRPPAPALPPAPPPRWNRQTTISLPPSPSHLLRGRPEAKGDPTARAPTRLFPNSL